METIWEESVWSVHSKHTAICLFLLLHLLQLTLSGFPWELIVEQSTKIGSRKVKYAAICFLMDMYLVFSLGCSKVTGKHHYSGKKKKKR